MQCTTRVWYFETPPSFTWGGLYLSVKECDKYTEDCCCETIEVSLDPFEELPSEWLDFDEHLRVIKAIRIHLALNSETSLQFVAHEREGIVSKRLEKGVEILNVLGKRAMTSRGAGIVNKPPLTCGKTRRPHGFPGVVPSTALGRAKYGVWNSEKKRWLFGKASLVLFEKNKGSWAALF